MKLEINLEEIKCALKHFCGLEFMPCLWYYKLYSSSSTFYDVLYNAKQFCERHYFFIWSNMQWMSVMKVGSDSRLIKF